MVDSEARGLRLSFAVAAGGAIGTTLRYAVSTLADIAHRPLTTLAVNVVGSLALGVLVAVLARDGDRTGTRTAFLATGVLGSFTTFSAFAVDGVRLLEDSGATLAAAYVVASLLGGLLAVRAGTRMVRPRVATNP